nr:MAG TPA: hypothetical protein [Caudoviricetes sp.]
MKKIKNVNGYAIYEAGERDVKKYGFAAGSFYVYFASDIRDFGLPGSTPEFEDCGSIEEAEANCAGNFAIAKEIVEGRTTAASMDEILEVEAQLDAGADPDDIADADCEDVQRAQESIETARAAAKVAGLPFSERLSEGAEDEPDPYVYDGGMTPEDYGAMQAARDAHEALRATVSERFPDMEPDTLDKLANTAAGLHIAPEELSRIIDAFDRIADTVKELAAKLVEASKKIAEFAVAAARNLYDAVARCCVPPKWIYLSKHAKKARTRKKYRNRIRREIVAALATGGGGSE